MPLMPPAAHGFALWSLGFRPFYLCASVFGAASVLAWAAQFLGWLPFALLPGPLWHGHEMLFGYTLAVMAGFLLTAVRAWTGEPTPAGAPLVALAGLWLLARVLMVTPFVEAAAAANAAFPAALALAIGIPLVRSGNRRNYFFVGLLLLLAWLAYALHRALAGAGALSPQLALQLALDVVLFVIAVMGGRVIPMFTNNGIPGAGATRRAFVERAALASVLALFAADLLRWPPAAVCAVAAVATLAHAARLALWRPWRTRATPLVWILHAGYAWVVAHLLLRAGAAAGWLAESYAVHALTTGAIGGLTLGMMVRTARGHTARPLAADGWECGMFVLVQLAALARVFWGIAFPAAYPAGIGFAGVAWAAALGLYAVRFWPVLTRPRLDGKPG